MRDFDLPKSRNTSVNSETNQKEYIMESHSAAMTDMLTLIESQLTRFKTIEEYVVRDSLYPGSIFVPQNLARIDRELNVNTELIVELIGFLDSVNLFCVSLTGSSSGYFDQCVSTILMTRALPSKDTRFGDPNLDDFVFANGTQIDSNEFLRNNPLLVGLWLYSNVYFMTFKQQTDEMGAK